MDVVFKEGLLYLQAVKFGKKTWRKIWMVLFKPSSTGVGRVELYTVVDNNTAAIPDLKKAGWPKSQARKVVRLSDCLSVTPAPKESCPSGCEGFFINTTSATYTLASQTTQEWISALCLLAFQKDPEDAVKGGFDRGNGLIMEDNDLYWSWESDTHLPPNVYLVTVRSTEASQRCNLSGEYLISPESDALLLFEGNTSDIIYRWPYKMLRKYGQVEGGFSIEAGRRCESGAGKFVFLSKQAQQIFQVISQQCTEKTSPAQQPYTQPLLDQSTLYSPNTTDPSWLQDSAHPYDNPLEYYSNIADGFKQLSLKPPHSSHSGEAMEEESEGEDDPGYSPETKDLYDNREDSIYYNLPRAVPVRMNDQFKDDDLDGFYSYVDKQNAPLTPPVESTTVQPASCPVPKPRYHLQQTMTNSVQPVYGTQTPVMDRETEEGISSTGQITPSEAPGSFKHRLAEIISKDLAKFQAPVPPRAASPPYSL